MIRKRIIVAIALIAVLLVVGTLVYSSMLNLSLLDAFYFTVVTVSTVGYGEIYPTTPESKLFTSILIILGIGALAVALETVAEEIAKMGVREALKPKEPDRRLLENHYIVCGYGRVGRIVVDELMRLGEKLVVIDKDPEVVRVLREKGIPVVEGSALEEEVLKKAGIEKAKGLAAVVGSDSDNVFITVTAKTLNPKIYVVARVSDETVMDKIYRVGADRVISPELEGGRMLARSLTHPHLVDVINRLTLTRAIELAQFRISEGSEARDMSISKLEDKTGAKIMAICDREGVKTKPEPSQTLEPGCIIFALGNKNQIRKLEETVEEEK